MGIRDDQLHPAQPAGLQRPQERGPERPVLAVADIKPQHLPMPVRGDAGRDHDGLRYHPVIDAGLAVGGVQEHVPERLPRQRPVPERRHLGIQIRADPADLGLGDTRVGAQRLHQIVDLPGGGAVQICLHDDGEQRLVHPPPPLQQGREERPGPQLRDPQLQVPCRRRPRPVSVALRQPRLGPLMRERADDRAQLGLDQRLIDSLGCLPDLFVDLGGLQCLQHFQQCRLVQGHRVSVSFRENHWRGLADHHTVAPSGMRRHAVRTEDLHHHLGRHPALRVPEPAPGPGGEEGRMA
jgi:hypothetical protein